MIILSNEALLPPQWEETYAILVKNCGSKMAVFSEVKPSLEFIWFINSKKYRMFEYHKMKYDNNIEDTDIYCLRLSILLALSS
ncbi:hypothetical protein SAE01_45940 [Segetibacter aerophilus]|uniref:Uncharacterized protein n=1 Tax=Segetibacter aerophilus TaxID=670293 RepID=A0A512BJF3_9BACT|nr:hypothetical protein SAE01_45940 [Segetibacter aerophilus]